MASFLPRVLRFFTILAAASMLLTSVARAEDAWDPIEPVNRGTFWVNDKLDIYLFEPIARGYVYITPEPVRIGVSNFFRNIRYPSYLVSDVVQFKFTNAWKDTERFAINTTVGVAGLCDVARDWGLPDHKKDFGIALAYHGVPAGPYLVLPILGPSNVRDGAGLIVDAFLNPFLWFSQFGGASYSVKVPVSVGSQALFFVDTRAGLLDAVQAAKESSLDYYLFVQSAYYQFRRGLLYEGHPPDEDEPATDADLDKDIGGSTESKGIGSTKK